MAKLNDVKVMEAKDGVVTKIRYAGEDYEKVSERAEVGDIVQSKGTKDAEEGNFYKTFVGHRRSPAIWDDVEDHRDDLLRFDVFRKVDAVLNVGDKVKLLDGGGRWPLYGFDNGKIYEVSDLNPGHMEGVVQLRDYQYGYAFPEQLEKVEEKPSFSTGDYAVIREGANSGRFDHGDVVQIIDKTPSNFDYFAVKVGGDDFEEAFDASELRKATEEEVTKAKGISKLSVGDYAKVVAPSEGIMDLSQGDIVRIRETGVLHDFIVDRVSDGESEAFFEIDLEKVDAPKPAEIQKGDLVRITEFEGGKPAGEIVEVTDVQEVLGLIRYPSDLPLDFAASSGSVELVCRKKDRKDVAPVG